MRIANWLPCILTSFALLAAGCGDDGAGGGVGGAGGTAGMGGAGGSDGSSSLQLTYEGDSLALDIDEVCLVNTDGAGASFSVVSTEGAPDQVALTLQSEDTDFTALLRMDSLVGADLTLLGSLDLADSDGGVVQNIDAAGAACTTDITFAETEQQGPTGSRYIIAFECATVPYDLFNPLSMMFVGAGTLTDLSGEFECIVTPLSVNPL